MILPYQYTPYIWPMLALAVITTALAGYAWHHRSVPGAFSFTLMMISNLLWTLSSTLELAAVDLPTKLLWAKPQGVWVILLVTTRLCFALDYANLGRWLNRRTLLLLAVPVLIFTLSVLISDTHPILWRGFAFDGFFLHPLRSVGGWIMTGYGYALSLVTFLVLFHLLANSPLHRWSVTLILIAMLAGTITFVAEAAGLIPAGPVDPVVAISVFAYVLHAVALFGFRMFDLIPIARETVIEQMHDGMLVLDTRRRIVSLNRAAATVLGLPAARARGRDAAQVLPAGLDLDLGARFDAPAAAQFELSLGAGDHTRHYTLHLSPLQDRRGLPLGHLLLFHDVTVQKRALAQLVKQQRALAVLEERAHLAREFHDGLGQALGYIKLQARVARDLLIQGQAAEAEAYLTRLASVAQEAHVDVREYLLGAGEDNASTRAFLDALQRYLERFSQNYAIRTDLEVSPAWTGDVCDPSVEAQLLRIVQEALSNARKHAHATRVWISLDVQNGRACITIRDDGQGFDPGQPADGEPRFGLRFMRERVEAVGGSLKVQSAPGQGTRIVVRVPARHAQEREKLREQEQGKLSEKLSEKLEEPA